MAKKFNIHDWQAKHLFEQDDFTPDLEDDELKRSKIQQMMAKEKGGKEGPPYISATQLFDNIIKGLETSGPYQDNIMFLFLMFELLLMEKCYHRVFDHMPYIIKFFHQVITNLVFHIYLQFPYHPFQYKLLNFHFL